MSIDPKIKKVLEKLPKCDLCGSQLREDGKCICIKYIIKEKEE